MYHTSNKTRHPAESIAFRIKASLFPMTFFQIHSACTNTWQTQMEHTIQQAPNLLKNALAIIDFEVFPPDHLSLDLTAITAHLRAHNIIPIGVTNIATHLHPFAEAAALPILSTHFHARNAPTSTTSGQGNTPPSSKRSTLLIDKPIRSGQQIYAKERDLIVLQSVSPGAELLADGHIHVYSTLRGRALAGVSGDTQARIFCKQLDAELVSIAGYYRLHEDLPTLEPNSPRQIFLRDEVLCIDII